ncbi:MAG: hypothetical protein GY821_00790 [Gammaproteobacteria bacterium]|nr:hypothetical protein [Gammaproteobacteria bacterium]
MKKDISDLRTDFLEKIRELSEENSRLKERVDLLEGQLKSIIEKGAGSSPPSPESGANFEVSVAKAVDDYIERQNKRKNLVIIGLPLPTPGQSESPVPSDLAKVQDLARALHINPGEISKVFRHGRERADGRPRITKVEFGSADARRRFLSGLRPHLLSSLPVGSRVPYFVRPDLTHAELLIQKTLNEERLRRKQAGEDVLVIFRGQVMPRAEKANLAARRSAQGN